MIPAERRAQLIRILNETGYAQVGELATELGISPITVRRDLMEMEKEGICIRKRGGAVVQNRGVTLELPYFIKQVQNREAKKRIAEAALKQISDSSTLILDSGSTTYMLATRLSEKKRLSVVTNDLQIATKLAANPDINMICTGGVARANVFSLQGAMAESCLQNVRVDVTFLGADAVHSDGGIYNVNIEEVSLKQAMMKAAATVILLADSSKFEIRGFYKICDLSQVDIVITDSQISPTAKALLEGSVRKKLILV